MFYHTRGLKYHDCQPNSIQGSIHPVSNNCYWMLSLPFPVLRGDHASVRHFSTRQRALSVDERNSTHYHRPSWTGWVVNLLVDLFYLSVMFVIGQPSILLDMRWPMIDVPSMSVLSGGCWLVAPICLLWSDFVTSLLPAQPRKTWIGLKLKQQDPEWVDDSPVSYLNINPLLHGLRRPMLVNVSSHSLPSAWPRGSVGYELSYNLWFHQTPGSMCNWNHMIFLLLTFNWNHMIFLL
jgi:hypothetical protein